MKKPKIIEGEWIYNAEWQYISSGSIEICVVNQTRQLSFQKELANAEAICAVPEMIDALIDIIQCQRDEKTGAMIVSTKKYLKAIEALKKAGAKI